MQLLVKEYLVGRIKEYETCLGVLKIVHFDGALSERFLSL